MDIQVGDRVTYKTLKNDKDYVTIIESDYDIRKIIERISTEMKYEQIKILKIERPKYEVVEEKKELLTEEEREFLKIYFNLTNLEYDKIKRDYDFLYCYIKESKNFMKIELNDFCFNYLEIDRFYTLQELGLEEN